MSLIRFQCYVCNQELQVSGDKAGRKAKCIQCGTVLTIPISAAEEEDAAPGPPGPPVAPPVAPPPPAGDDEPAPRRRSEEFQERDREDDYDRSRRRRDEARGERGSRRRDDYDDRRGDYDDRRRDDRDDRRDDRSDDYDDRGPDDYDDLAEGKSKKWKTQPDKLKLGMLLGLIGLAVVGGGFVMEQIGALILVLNSFSRIEPGTGGVVRIFTLMGNIFILLGLLCALAGQVFWMFISPKQGGFVWAIVALSVGGVSLIFFLIFRFIPIVSATQLPYGIFIYFGGGFRLSLGYAILPSFALIFFSAHYMMIGFYVQAFGKTLKDRTVTRRGTQTMIAAATSAGYQLLWPFIGWAFIPSVPGAGSPTGALVGTAIFYFGGVVALFIMHLGAILTANMCRIVADYS